MEDKLVEEIEAFLDRTGMAAATYGRKYMGDPMFVLEVRRGRKPSPATAERLRKAMSEHRDDG